MRVSVTLFLDFDGVAHPEWCHYVDRFCCLPRIEQVLREHLTVEVVISSSWRHFTLFEDMCTNFSADIRSRVIGMTSSVEPGMNRHVPEMSVGYSRERECEDWMRRNRAAGSSWLAIDDRASWFQPESVHLLLTDSEHGFQPGDADTLRKMLRERL